MNIWNYKFEDPQFLWLLIIVPIIVFWYIYKENIRYPEQKIPSLQAFENQKKSLKEIVRHSLIVFRILAIALLIIALARPQSALDKEKITTKGIDIVLAMDISTSMLARDFKPDRLEAAKEVATEFIEGRPNDRIGLVVFAGESFTQCPITSDKKVLINLISKIKTGIIEDGTAIGLGLATSIDRLKDSGGKSKVVIILTDGENNRGFIDPITAAEIAKEFNIRIYTIGVGTRGEAPYPFKTPFGIQIQNVKVDIDEELLQEIASITGTKYFRATDNQKLKDIYAEIDKMEKSKIEVTSFRRHIDKFFPFALIALILITIEILLRNLIFKNYP
ncbi:MAG: VWA domain-containing protein [Bacteroidota bacterium]|nr:VWA domain-containing protein [Bacteroidota bacterium]